MELSADLAEKFMRKMGAIKDAAIRRALLTKELAELEIEQMAQALFDIIKRADSGNVAYKDMLHSLGDFSDLIERAGDEKINEVYEFCIKNEMMELGVRLRRIPPKRHANENPDEIYMDNRLKDLALGMRKSMGRTGNIDLINRLLHDQDPNVVEQILANPSLTEEQVVKIAAKRPTSAEVLRKISNSVRWIKRYRIKKALVYNPYTPTELSINLVKLLMRQDIIGVAQNESLHFELRQMAKKIISDDN